MQLGNGLPSCCPSLHRSFVVFVTFGPFVKLPSIFTHGHNDIQIIHTKQRQSLLLLWLRGLGRGGGGLKDTSVNATKFSTRPHPEKTKKYSVSGWNPKCMESIAVSVLLLKAERARLLSPDGAVATGRF